MKKLGLNQVNLENYKNQLIINMLNDEEYNDNNVMSLMDLIGEIKDSEKFKNVYIDFYNKCERSILLSKYLHNSNTYNTSSQTNLMNFYEALTNDELLQLLDLF